MPFSRSSSFESIARSSTSACASKELVWRSIASTRVVLPWSTWATIATLRRSERVAIAIEVVSSKNVGKKEGGWSHRCPTRQVYSPAQLALCRVVCGAPAPGVVQHRRGIRRRRDSRDLGRDDRDDGKLRDRHAPPLMPQERVQFCAQGGPRIRIVFALEFVEHLVDLVARETAVVQRRIAAEHGDSRLRRERAVAQAVERGIPGAGGAEQVAPVGA